MCAAADLIAAQYRGLLSYIKLRGLTGAKASAWREKAARQSSLLAERWYDRKNCRFYGAMDSSGQMFPALGSPHLLAYFDAVQDEVQRLALLDQIHDLGKSGIIVELLSHYPEIFFRHGQPERGVFWLRQLTDPALPRREYPEASFAAIGAYVTGLLGVAGDARSRTLRTDSRCFPYIRCAHMENCPLFEGYIDLTCEGQVIQIRNRTGAPLYWQGKRVPDSETAESAIVE